MRARKGAGEPPSAPPRPPAHLAPASLQVPGRRGDNFERAAGKEISVLGEERRAGWGETGSRHPAAALERDLRRLPPRNAAARSRTPRTASSRPREAFSAPPQLGNPAAFPGTPQGRKSAAASGLSAAKFRTAAAATCAVPAGVALMGQSPRGPVSARFVAHGVLSRTSTGNSPAIDFESVLREPWMRPSAPGSAAGPVSSGSDRWGVYTRERLRPARCLTVPRQRLHLLPGAVPSPRPRSPSHTRSWPTEAGARRGAERATAGELAGSSRNFFWQGEGAVCRGGPNVRGGGALYLSLLTLHVFRHLSLFPIRPGESQGFRLHFGQHDKAAASRAGGSVSVRDTSTWTRQHRFSWSKGRSAAAASSSSSSLPLLHASPYSAAAGAPSGPSRREAPPGARGWLSRGAVVRLQAAGRRGEEEEEDRGCRGGRRNPGARSSAWGSTRRQPGAPIHAERHSAQERSAAAGAAGQGSHPRPPPPFLPPPPPSPPSLPPATSAEVPSRDL